MFCKEDKSTNHAVILLLFYSSRNMYCFGHKIMQNDHLSKSSLISFLQFCKPKATQGVFSISINICLTVELNTLMWLCMLTFVLHMVIDMSDSTCMFRFVLLYKSLHFITNANLTFYFSILKC